MNITDRVKELGSYPVAQSGIPPALLHEISEAASVHPLHLDALPKFGMLFQRIILADIWVIEPDAYFKLLLQHLKAERVVPMPGFERLEYHGTPVSGAFVEFKTAVPRRTQQRQLLRRMDGKPDIVKKS